MGAPALSSIDHDGSLGSEIEFKELVMDGTSGEQSWDVSL